MVKVKKSKGKYRITYGGWYQRTTLHLSEIYDLLALGKSKLDLSKKKIAALHQQLDLQQVSREAGYLEFVKAKTKSGIDIRYYEDGLYILELESTDIKTGQNLLENYFNNTFQPAINYIFSLGAPTPKILANIETVHPIVIGLSLQDPGSYQVDPEKFGKVYSQISLPDTTVYKTPKYIFVAVLSKSKLSPASLIEMQIFFREFKDQLEKYLDIHRDIWEHISAIKEKKFIKGKDLATVRSQLDSYQKTVSLIENRINQMGTYIDTRASIAKHLKIKKHLLTFFQYKFEILTDTLSYIKELWEMTSDYLANAIQVVVEIENQTATASIESLRIITTIGVISGLIAYLAQDQLPQITTPGLIYFIILMLITWLVNKLVVKVYKTRKHRLSFTERASNI